MALWHMGGGSVGQKVGRRQLYECDFNSHTNQTTGVWSFGSLTGSPNLLVNVERVHLNITVKA